jgi:hypothetical protein
MRQFCVAATYHVGDADEGGVAHHLEHVAAVDEEGAVGRVLVELWAQGKLYDLYHVSVLDVTTPLTQ